ncbi:MAG: DUF4838 domain-containing protein [Victivallales bacterium]
MSNFTFGESVKILSAGSGSPCHKHAVSELCRILDRLGVKTSVSPTVGRSGIFNVRIFCDADPFPDTPSLNGIFSDGFALHVSSEGIALASSTDKGILNSVYDLAERLGVLFLMPGEDGEWIPEKRKAISIAAGKQLVNPRFKYHGVYWEKLAAEDFTVEEWLRFYAKLRFNAVWHEIGDLALAKELGFRLEVGGHGLAKLLPRELFDREPELFRMFQPEDFGGKRTKDSNFCVINPKTRQIIMDNFAKKLKQMEGAYAVHAFADDLPAGGWCLCPSCRALPPTDQAMLATRYLAETVEKSHLPIRVSIPAYHDTMMPGRQIDAPKEAFLLFAPRERCYGHALGDPSCARNRFYLHALRAWVEKFRGIDDSHAHEYYFDQILFRGLYPFLPGIILEDMKVYAEYGIECYMSLQVAGPAVAPEFNMLVYAKGLWDESLTQDAYIAALSKSVLPESPQVWNKYLSSRARIFTDAMRMCDHNIDIYLDYRWLPETVHPFGREMAKAYSEASKQLTAAVADLESAIQPSWPERVTALLRKESLRAKFEAAELLVMSCQQSALNDFTEFMNTRSADTLRRAISSLEQAISGFEPARAKAVEAGIPANSWYFSNINSWMRGEFKRKIDNYKLFLPSEK